MLKSAIPILASLNMPETIEFYTSKLGFTYHAEWEGYLILSRDGVYFHFWSTDDDDIPKNTGCYVNVTDIDALYALYEPEGVVHPNGPLANMPGE